LASQEPNRVDLAEELAVTLAQLARVVEEAASPTVVAEAVGILEIFERAGHITPKGSAVLALGPAVTAESHEHLAPFLTNEAKRGGPLASGPASDWQES